MKAWSLAVVGVMLLTLPRLSGQENWPQFRGPNAGVIPDNPALPETWTATENVAWKTPIPGVGWGSPVVWGDHIFVTAAINTGAAEPIKTGPLRGGDVVKPAAPYRWVVYDVSLATGRIRWQKEVATSVPADGTHMKNSYASETPVTDGERVYAYFGNLGVFVFDMTGRAVWSHPMGPFKFRSGWGSAASPVLHEDRLFIVNDNDTQSFVVAYDKRTGRELWKREREIGTNWATPFVWKNDLRTELVVPGSVKTRAYDLDGKVLWELSGMSTIDVPTPFAAHGLLFINSGYVADALRPVYAIRPGASGDVSLNGEETSNAHIAWSHRTLGSYNPSSLVFGDYYYTLHDRGFFTANDARTGREVYGRQRVSADAVGFSASPWAYNGRIFALSEDGDTYVLAAGPEFKVIGKNSIDERTLATPAIAGNSLIIRTASNLLRITRPRSGASTSAQASRPPPRFVTDDPGCQASTLVSTGGTAPRDPNTLAIRWTGFSNFELAYKGQVLLLDAYFDRGAVFPPLGFRAADVRRADGILIGHGHADHMSDAATVAVRTGARVVGAAVTTETLAAQSVPSAQVITANGRGGEILRFGAFTVEPILGSHGEPALDVLQAFQTVLDATNPKRTAEEIAEQAAIRAKGASSPLLASEGTLTYVIALDSGFRVIYRDSGGVVTDWERRAMGRIGSVDVALVALPQYIKGSVTAQALAYVDTYKPSLFIPAHHDAPRDGLWRPTEPVFQALKDQHPRLVTVSRAYREPVCVDARMPKGRT